MAATRLPADAPRRRQPVNLSVRADVIAAARRHGLNASRIAEEALAAAVNETERARWLADNAEAIDAHNARVARAGLYNRGLRRF
jgi:antitoxin CcdA